MTREALLAELMRLPIEERRAVAREVLEHSDDEPMHADAEASLLAELDRRRKLIEAGEMTFSPWEEVEARIFGRHGR